MVEDWIKSKTTISLNQSPNLREKAILLVKLMQNVEKRFSDETELNAQFLELVNHIYRDEMFLGSELTSKLEVDRYNYFSPLVLSSLPITASCPPLYFQVCLPPLTL